MNKLLRILTVSVMIAVMAFSGVGCNNNSRVNPSDPLKPIDEGRTYWYNQMTRGNAARLIDKFFDFTGGDELPIDVNASHEYVLPIKSCASRNIFGRSGREYKFRPNDILTRYELAKISLGAYAALVMLDVDNLEPGTQSSISDISSLEVEQRWIVHSALSYGFVTPPEENKFVPTEKVGEREFTAAMREVKRLAGVQGTDFTAYKKGMLDNFYTAPSRDIPCADKLYIYNCGMSLTGCNNSDSARRLFISSLQGLVNRNKVQLYVAYYSYHWDPRTPAPPEEIANRNYTGYKYISDLAIQYGYFSGYEEELINPTQLIDTFKDYAKKVLVVDLNNRTQINTATEIAAIEGRVIVTETGFNTLNLVKEVNPDADIKYMSALNLTTQYSAQVYSYENNFEYMRRDIIAYSSNYFNTEWQRDYFVQMKIPAVWISSANAADHTPGIKQYVGDIFAKFPYNIPIIGVQYEWHADDPRGSRYFEWGLGEVEGTYFACEYGKYTAVWDTVGNLSFHTAIKVAREDRKFRDVYTDDVTYDPSKKYASIFMGDSGDSAGYIQCAFNYYQWGQLNRGETPYTYSYAVNNFDLNPLLTQYIFDTAGPGDYFQASVSGLGYIYPLNNDRDFHATGYYTGGFGCRSPKTEDGVYLTRADAFKDHYEKTSEMCKRMGFTSFAAYSFIRGTLLREEDYDFINENIIAHLTGMDFITFDLHRQTNGDTPLENTWVASGYGATPEKPLSQLLLKDMDKGIVVYHNSGVWNYNQNRDSEDRGDYGDIWSEKKEQQAIEWMANDILNQINGEKGQFYNFNAYSWHYGPRRVKAVMDIVRAARPDVIFVTAGQLDRLYRASKI